jgi:hypothetical protein
MIPAEAVLLTESVAKILSSLEAGTAPRGQAIARRLRALKPVLLVDCLHGEVVRKGAIPPSLRAKHGLENLHVEDLPDCWCLLYTIVRRGGRRVVVVIEIVDHRQYGRWFPGRHR